MWQRFLLFSLNILLLPSFTSPSPSDYLAHKLYHSLVSNVVRLVFQFSQFYSVVEFTINQILFMGDWIEMKFRINTGKIFNHRLCQFSNHNLWYENGRARSSSNDGDTCLYTTRNNSHLFTLSERHRENPVLDSHGVLPPSFRGSVLVSSIFSGTTFQDPHHHKHSSSFWSY